jgi:hypothetical protein
MMMTSAVFLAGFSPGYNRTNQTRLKNQFKLIDCIIMIQTKNKSNFNRFKLNLYYISDKVRSYFFM